MVIEHPIEDEVTQLARRVEKARGRLAYQFDPALTEALSEDELYAERELAERIRTQERGQRWKEAQAAAAASDRARQTTEAIEKADMRDLLLARKAIAAQRRESSPHAKLASLYRHRSWSLRALAGVVAAGMLWSAVNVQHNIAPGGATDPLYWFSYLLEGMISVCLIIIMIGTNKVAEWGVVDNRRQVAAAEVALLALTVSLNTYPYLRAGAWYDAAVHAIAPVMIGVALLIHDAASARYGLAIARATEQVRDLPDPAEQIRLTLPRYRMPAAPEAPSVPHEQVHQQPEPVVAAPPVQTVEQEVVEVAETQFPSEVPDEQPVATVKAEKKRPPVEAPRKPVLPESIEDLDAMEAFTSPVRVKDADTIVTNGGAPAANGKKLAAAEPVAPVPAVKSEDRPAARVPAEEPAPAKVVVRQTPQATPRPAVSETEAATAEIPAVTRQPLADVKSDSTMPEPKNGKDIPKPDVAQPPTARPPDIYDTGSFRVADILEQELAELQAERRRARTSRQRSASTAGRES
ncbi:hypothetical protein U3653_04805 [Nocardia sp. CDC186]|uniref:Uncharacterized protein n=1 Tax=Nocardia implantans TaxID=3108168 RepID=A0ABU6APR1_9NOCA|nr:MULTISPECIES: hypothetical protein [unclassified Nocardia]MBF6189681.1 hypothetical protein [Nocardia beijingensis]MEA3527089.1 hypothetical protein [Nocardia sp. CDC192]MEB3509333.1 hypothetical protein [Nocardia sp. CDC186]